jgi:hypothetical protein
MIQGLKPNRKKPNRWFQFQDRTEKNRTDKSLDRMALVEVTPGVDFINVLRAAFAREDPKSTKKYSKVVRLFCTFGIFLCKSCS